MFSGLGYSEMFLFGVIALMLFGAKLPEVARNLGGSYRELRKHLNDFQKSSMRSISMNRLRGQLMKMTKRKHQSRLSLQSLKKLHGSFRHHLTMSLLGKRN